MAPLTLKLVGDTEVHITRRFAATPEAVWRAHTDPKIIPKWLTGPDGWTMTRCDMNPDGSIRYDWANTEGHSFHLTGELLELDPPRRIVHVERMFLPDPTPDNHVETTFEPDGAGGTLMRMVMRVPDRATRDAMVATGMADGMEDSYARLETMEAA